MGGGGGTGRKTGHGVVVRGAPEPLERRDDPVRRKAQAPAYSCPCSRMGTVGICAERCGWGTVPVVPEWLTPFEPHDGEAAVRSLPLHGGGGVTPVFQKSDTNPGTDLRGEI